MKRILFGLIRSIIFRFSLSKLQTKHKSQIYDFHFSLSEIINTHTNTNTNSHDSGELNPEKKKNWRTGWSEAVSRLWPWARKMRGAEDCAKLTVRDRRRRGRNGVERVESLGPVTLTELGTAARVGPAVRGLADLALLE